MRSYFVYILASRRNGTLYVGVTNSLERRIYEHRHHLVKSFTDSYNVTRLVYFEEVPSIETAIIREKQLKGWRRDWKIALIETDNPKWRDLADDFSLDSRSSLE